MAMTPAATLDRIYRYPVKGLSPEPLPRVALRPGDMLPHDRRYAVENGPSGFDAEAPKWQTKNHYLMLMRDERLAALRTRYDDATHVLTIGFEGRDAAKGDLETEAGRAAIEGFLASYCAGDLKGPPKVLSAPGYSFSDVPRKVVSIINLATVAALEDDVGQPVDPLRFRANFYVSGWPAWREFDLVGQTLAIGAARLGVVKRIVRCAAVNVDPATAARDLNLPQTLMQRYGHADCGVYAEVIAGGDVATGDAIAVAS
jgi:uncharacterized protein YcbX